MKNTAENEIRHYKCKRTLKPSLTTEMTKKIEEKR